MDEFDIFIETLAAMGEEEVRQKLSQGVWANRHKTWAQDWINNLDASQVTDRAEKELTLLAEANDIAHAALGEAKSAKTISIVAMILSAVVAIAVAVIQFVGQPT